VQRGITHHLLTDAGLRANEGQGGAVTLIQRFGSAANLNIHLHCLVLDGVYRCDADGAPNFVEADTPTDDQLHALLQTIIARLMKMGLAADTGLTGRELAPQPLPCADSNAAQQGHELPVLCQEDRAHRKFKTVPGSPIGTWIVFL